jgi:transketolase
MRLFTLFGAVVVFGMSARANLVQAPREVLAEQGIAVLGIDRFAESAPAGDLFKYFDFTVDNFVAQVKSVL